MIRSDILRNRKHVHLKFRKEVHTFLKIEMFKHGLTMQDIFQDYAERLWGDPAFADKMFKQVSVQKIQRDLKRKKRKKEILKNSKNLKHADLEPRLVIEDVDNDSLYSLLEAVESKSVQNEDED